VAEPQGFAIVDRRLQHRSIEAPIAMADERSSDLHSRDKESPGSEVTVNHEPLEALREKLVRDGERPRVGGALLLQGIGLSRKWIVPRSLT